MAEIRTYKCDVKDCHRQLASNLGSTVRLEIKTPPHWSAPALSTPDLCDIHLAELMAFFETRKLELTPDC